MMVARMKSMYILFVIFFVPASLGHTPSIQAVHVAPIDMNMGDDMRFQGWAFDIEFDGGADLALSTDPNISISTLSLDVPPGQGGDVMPPAITRQMGGSALHCPCDNCDPEGMWADACDNGGQCIWSSDPDMESHGPPSGLLPMPAVEESPSVLFAIFAGKTPEPTPLTGRYIGFKITRMHEGTGGNDDGKQHETMAKKRSTHNDGTWLQMVPPTIDPASCYVNFTDGFYADAGAVGTPPITGLTTSPNQGAPITTAATIECRASSIGRLLEEIANSTASLTATASGGGGKNAMERAMWDFASYEIRDAWRGCQALLDSFVTKGTGYHVLPGSTECTHDWQNDNAAWQDDPCCNHALLMEQCCLPTARNVSMPIITGLDAEAIGAACRTPDRSTKVLRLAIEAQGEAAKCEEKAAARGASFDVWERLNAFVQTCHEEIYGKGGSPPACRVDEDCYTTCNTHSQTCVIPWGSAEGPLLECFLDNMHSDVERHLRKKWGLKTYNTTDDFQAAFRANMQDPTCVGPEAWKYADTWESLQVEECDSHPNGPTQHCWCPHDFVDQGIHPARNIKLPPSSEHSQCVIYRWTPIGRQGAGKWDAGKAVPACPAGSNGGKGIFCLCVNPSSGKHHHHAREEGPPLEGGSGDCWLSRQVPANATACVEETRCNWNTWATNCTVNPENPDTNEFCGECHGSDCWEIGQPSSCHGWMPPADCTEEGGEPGPWGGDHCIWPDINDESTCLPALTCPPPDENDPAFQAMASMGMAHQEQWCNPACYHNVTTVPDQTTCDDVTFGDPSSGWDAHTGLCRKYDAWSRDMCLGQGNPALLWWPGRTWKRGQFETESACGEGRCNLNHGLTAAECTATAMCTQSCTSCRASNHLYTAGLCYGQVEGGNATTCMDQGGQWIEPDICVLEAIKSAGECTALQGHAWASCAAMSNDTDGACSACSMGDGEACPLPVALAGPGGLLSCHVDAWSPCANQERCETSGLCNDWDMENWHATECRNWPRNETACAAACIFAYDMTHGWPNCPWSQDGSYQWTRIGCANRTITDSDECAFRGGSWHPRATVEAECTAHGSGCEEERFWDLTSKGALECGECGGTPKPFYTWTPGAWITGSMQPLSWKTRTLEPINEWKPALNWTKLHEAMDEVVGTVMAANLKSTLMCKYNQVASALKSIACDCGVMEDGGDACYEGGSVEWTPVAEGEAFSGVERKLHLGPALVIIGTDTIDAETDSMTIQVSTIPDLEARLGAAAAAGIHGDPERRRTLTEPNEWDVVFVNDGTKHVGQVVGPVTSILAIADSTTCLKAVQGQIDVADPQFITPDFGIYNETSGTFVPRHFFDITVDLVTEGGPYYCRTFTENTALNDAAILRFNDTTNDEPSNAPTATPTTGTPTTTPTGTPTVTPTTGTPTGAPTTAVPTTPPSGLSDGAIVGISMGSVVGFGVAVAVIAYVASTAAGGGGGAASTLVSSRMRRRTRQRTLYRKHI